MHTIDLQLETPISSSEIVLAWAILWKDYVASADIWFYLSDTSRSSDLAREARTVALSLDEKQTIQELRHQVDVQLNLEGDDEESTKVPSLQAHLSITREPLACQPEGRISTDRKDLDLDSWSLRSNRLDLKVNLALRNQGTHARVEIAANDSGEISDRQTIRILQQLEHVIRQVHFASSNNDLVYNITTASQQDARDVWAWNRERREPVNRTVVEIFASHVQRDPEALAVDAWDGSFTYSKLDRLSTVLSLRLARYGVRNGIIVPLCFEKTRWTLVAILAVLKTGAAFVLLDEALPQTRLQQLADIIAGEKVLVLTSAAQQHRAEPLSTTCVVVDSTLFEQERPYSGSAATKPNPSDLAYIVFTSGTTGVPKAAMARHSNICSFATFIAPADDVSCSSRILLLASYAFDMSIGNIFLSLITGACLCMPSSWECKNNLSRIVNDYQATYVHATPSVSKMIDPQQAETLQVLELSGEPCNEDALYKWRGTNVRVMNTCGHAECSVTSVVNEDILSSEKPSIIGKGISCCWLMDPVRPDRLAPIGGIGVLILEGPLVGPGYLHGSKATQAKFFEDPDWLLSGLAGVSPGRTGRLYNTGDLVRYKDDGEIEYVGRRDLQVKIRGQRVELEELAVNVQKWIPGSVQWCPEVVRIHNGAELLAIFLVPSIELNDVDETLRTIVDLVDRETRRNLPTAMIPGAYIRIEDIPLTLSGKTDHRRLKEIALAMPHDRLIFPQKPSISSLNAFHFAKGVPSHFDAIDTKSSACSTEEEYSPRVDDSGSTSRSEVTKDSSLASPNDALHHVTMTLGKEPQQIDDASCDAHDAGLNSKIEKMKSVWSEVFDIDTSEIQSTDSFFGYGGQSLTAIKLVGLAARQGVHTDVATVFQHPQLSDLAAKCQLTSFSRKDIPDRFALLPNAALLTEMASSCRVSLDEIEDAYPCTPMQEGLITTAGKEGPSYTGRGVLDLPRGIDPERLAGAWQRVVATHAILRTRIVDTESYGLFQVVLKNSESPASVKRGSLKLYLDEDAKNKMGLSTQLCRGVVLWDSDRSHFVLTMHHATYDGWTLPRIGIELFRAYQGVRLQLDVGFNTFINHISALPRAPAENFWAGYLEQPENTSFFPSLPTFVRQPRADSVCVKEFDLVTDQTRGISTPSILRAAWALLMSKLSGADDITFGTILSGRNVPVIGVENLLSPTISAVPVRVKLDAEESTGSFVSRIQKESLDTIPFEPIGLQNIRKISSSTRTGCNFQTLFIVHPQDPAASQRSRDFGPSEQKLEKLLESLDISTAISDFNEYSLMLLISHGGGRLAIEASFDSRVLETARVDLLLDQFVHMAEQVGSKENSATTLSAIQGASDKDLEMIWNWNSETFETAQLCIHDLIANTISQQPTAHAIQAHDGIMTYEELEMQSAHLSSVLRNKGVGSGSLVPICMEKSKWATVAMLAILRAGAAFVAMDIRQQPLQRLRRIVKEVGAEWVVTNGVATTIAQQLSTGIIICDDLLADGSTSSSSVIPSKPSRPSDTAFIVFTSGSTGVPKGIVITHANFCSTIPYHERKLLLSNTSRIYDYASYSFDIAVHNALMAMTLGGCLCVPSEGDRDNDVEGSIERLRANWADLTPSVARLIDPPTIPSLKTLVLSGEAVGKDIIHHWSGSVELINGYGPAECQICTIQESLQDSHCPSQIGRGVACSTWIVDPETCSISPIGAVGELLIEGPIVSPGYLNASNDSFLQDPIWLLAGSTSVPGRTGTVYRTGDLASYQPDGAITYVGRATTQAKINGQRVELGEIEHHVRRSIPEVQDVVADIITVDGISQVAAYLYRKSNERTTDKATQKANGFKVRLIPPPSTLKDSLKDLLPSYMIPSLFFQISHVPLSSTGKVDRRKLKESVATLSRNDIVAVNQPKQACDEVELSDKHRNMMQTWSIVLKLEDVNLGLNSDFFQSGGDSVSAMRLVKIARRRGLSFTVAEVFRNSQLGQLCGVATECIKHEPLENNQAQSVPPFGLVPPKDRNALVASAAKACDISVEDVVDIYPCTPFQEGVFAQTATNSSAYIQHTMLKFSTDLSFARVLAAWESAISSNPILRTRIFQSEEGNLMQLVIREVPEWRRYTSAEEYLAEAAETDMLLGNSLSRLALLRPKDGSASTNDNTIIWSIHHALYDAWTIGLILREVSDYYHGKRQVDYCPDYNTYVQFLRNQKETSENWWRARLTGASNAALFPKVPMTNQRVSPVCTKRRAISLPLTLPAGYTLPVLLRSAWTILMNRYSAGDHVLFGEVRLGRNVPIKNIDTMRGPTIASVPTLVPIQRDQTISSLLEGIRETDIQMQEHDHLGLQNIAKLSTDTKAACGFQTLLVFRENEDQTIEGDSIFTYDDSIDDIRNFHSWNFMVIFHHNSTGLVAEAVFRESLIPAGRVDLLLQQTQSIFQDVCKRSLSSLINEFDAPVEEDLERIWRWNADAPEAVDEYLHELVAQQARRTPNKMAVLAHDGQMTYKELDQFSSNLATKLRSLGIGVGCYVPLCFEKSLWVPVAMLAVIKTGAAFSVMDVSYPETRLEIVVNLLKTRLILASPLQQDLARRLCDNIFIVDHSSSSRHYKIDNALLENSKLRDTDQIMYVCFTSGSTGIPKGVMVTHRNLASAGIAQTRDLDFVPEDRVYDFSSHAFDANIWHTWWALIIGACLCIPSHEDRMGNLAGSIESFGSTALFLTPSVARTLDPTEIPSVKRLYLGGEAVTPLDVSMWREYLDLWCAYGPTETTPLCIFTRLSSPESASNIGRGSGVNPWVCNPENYNELVAVGTVGEMLMEGPLVTLGYYQQPEKTSAVFVSDPEFLLRGTKSQPGRRGRLYRSGDLVRYCYDGTIEYLGRADTQVKLRGQRVEFGEVEYHLKNALPAFTTVCEIITHGTGRPMLVAFCASISTTNTPDQLAARKYLNKRLPPYMTPEAFLQIEDIPRNPSGKIDRQRLRQLGPQLLHSLSTGEQKSHGQMARPLNETETLLQQLWATALGQDALKLEPDSDFFDVGADSIAAMKLSNLARKKDLQLSMSDIVKNSRLEAMSMTCRPIVHQTNRSAPFSLLNPAKAEQVKRKAAQTCEVQVESISDIYPCTPMQTELFALTLRQPEAYIRRCVFEVPITVDFKKLVHAWNTVININDSLRTSFVEIEDQGLSQVVTNTQVELAEGFNAYLSNGPPKFDFGTPLSRVVAFPNENPPKIFWTIHHALYDGWSVQLIEDQLRRAYEGGKLSAPPAFSEFVRQVVSRDQQEANDFWKHRLSGCASTPIYPPLPAGQYQARPCQTFNRTLKAKVSTGVNIQPTIHAAWALIVAQLSECDDVVFAATLSGRDAWIPDVEQIVGPTITPVPIRIRVDRTQLNQEFISRVERDTATMAPYQHVGMKAIERINKDTRAACKLQTLLVVTPANAESPDAIEIRSSSYEVEDEHQSNFHTFGLVLFFTPTQDAIELEIVYDPALIDYREIERLSGRLEAVIPRLGAGRDHQVSVADVECLGAEDLEDIWRWNSNLPQPSEKLLHHVILEQAKRRGSDPAIEAWDVQINYTQLQLLSQILEKQLRQLGISRGSIVPLVAQKSGYIPVAALAVLRAGATILPFDATQPSDRLRQITEQVKPSVIIVSQACIDIATGLASHIVSIEQCLQAGTEQSVSSSNSDASATPDDAACILFTSGSTGVPKGVLHTHSALVSAVHYQAQESGFHETTRAFDFASYGFDVSWNMIFKTFALGGTICVPSEDERQNDLVGALNRSKATLTELTASVARLIDPSKLSTLETLIMSGESVDLRAFQLWRPKVRLVVCYGPSECTSVTTINPGTDRDSSQSGIGRASACLTWLVDPQNQRRLVPVGAVGEIIIDGPIVGKGYYNNELQTSQSYTSDLPWIKHIDGHGPRLAFKSGDLARYDMHGNLHFVSRKDTQVKLYGQRIELEEVQHHVRAIIGDFVSSVVCCVTEQANSTQKQLVTFLSHEGNSSTGSCTLICPSNAASKVLDTLDEKLRTRVPKYMIPAAYYFVTKVPRCKNGKIDRKVLVQVALDADKSLIYHGRPESHTNQRLRLTPAEAEMQQLWSAALGISADTIGPDDHFFNLNGDSISAMKLVANARNKGHNLRVSDVFTKPVLSELARTIKYTSVEEKHAQDYKAFEMLGKDTDETSIRMEVAQSCCLSDLSIIEDVYPCTPLQENMLAATIKDPHAFISMRPYRIPAEVNIHRLQAAWATVVARNRILRTRLVDLRNHGIQQVALSGQSAWESYSSTQSFLDAEQNLEMGIGSRLTRWALIEQSHERWLVWTIHHAMYDGWSLQMIEAEVKSAYLGQSLPASHPDMRPMIKYLSEHRKEMSLEFWGAELKGAEQSFCFPPLPHQDYQPTPKAYLEKTIEADLSDLPNGLNLNSLIYGSWSLEISAASSHTSISFGTIVTGRYAPVNGIDKLMGPTITTVPVLVKIDGSENITGFLSKLQDISVRRIPHEHLGVSGIRQINAGSAAACKFQTVLVIQPPALSDNALQQTKEPAIMEEIDETQIDGFPDQHAVLNQYGLMMEILPIGRRTTIRASFDEQLISSQKMERILGRWEHTINKLLQSAQSEPLIALKALEQLNPLDMQQIWNQNKHLPENSESLVHETILQVSSRQPNALAIDACDGQLTYQQLETLSSRLSERLIQLGVGPGCFVPLIFRKSKWANVSMLAVVKTGAAFVPLDAEHPEGRLRAVMQPLQAEIILCSATTRDRAARLARNALMVDDSLYATIATLESSSASQNQREIKPSDLAYVVFTSGSTGAPKGVKINHRNLATAIEHQVGEQGYRINSRSRVLDSSSYSFDACVCNFFYTVTNGGCLCIPDESSLKGDLGSFMRASRVNWAQLVPSVARTMAPESLPDLRDLVLTGEALTRGDIAAWGNNVRLLNVYGPTECTIFCAISSPLTSTTQVGHIGQGYGANLWLTEIGNPDKLVPIGSVGEILIEGPVIGQGYMGPYEWPLVIDPPWLLSGTESTPGRSGAMFRTGDQAYVNDDGSLTLIGRIGSDIKLRGQRVDLLEVEDIARNNDSIGLEIVADIASMSWGEVDQERQMLLLFVANRDATADQTGLEDKIRAWVPDFKQVLNDALPSYLQPEAIILLPRIPKTSSAKTDRRQLKEIGGRSHLKQLVWISSDAAITTSTPPASQEQQHLAGLWSEILGIDATSIVQEDDFFLLGGTSLGVMRLTTRAYEHGIRLKTQDVFQFSKLAELASKMEPLIDSTQLTPYKPYSLAIDILDPEAFIKETVTSMLDVPASEVEDILPANGFQVDYMHNEEEPLGLQYAYLDVSPKISWPRLIEACRTVVQSLQSLRSRFLYHNGKYYQIVLRNAPLLHEELVTDEQMTTFSNQLCARDCRAAAITDIYTKLTVVDAGGPKRRVILRTSHTQYDGWCINRMLLAIARVYNGGEVGKVPDWTRLLSHRQQQVEPSQAYWRSVLEGTTRMTPPLIYKPGGTKVRTLRTYALPNFQASNNNRRTRPTVVINVAWALLLQQLMKHDDLVFGNVTTGRNGSMPGLDDVMGPCVNMLPMRMRLDSEAHSGTRKQQLLKLVEASAKQVDERTSFEGLDWDSMVDDCTDWSSGMRYTSAVHFRNMAFEPELTLDGERVVVVWYELVATPHWTTMLVYPEEDILRLWLLANPAEIGDEGGDEMLDMLAAYVSEILEAIRDDTD